MRWGELTSGKREAPAPLEGNIRATVIGITAIEYRSAMRGASSASTSCSARCANRPVTK
jgi:hypothetical protein